jgi:hypothetical protein
VELQNLHHINIEIYTVIILSDNYHLPFPIAVFIILTDQIHETSSTHSGAEAGSKKLQLPDKIKSLYNKNILFYVQERITLI